MNIPASNYPLVQLRHMSAIPISNGLGEAGDPANDATWPRYIRTTDIASVRKLDPRKRVTLPPELARQASVLRNDILMTSAGATVGKSYLHLTDEVACFAGYLSRLRVREDRAVPEFVAYWTESSHFLDQVQAGAVKSTIENFSAAKYRALWIPKPNLEQQRAIADYLDRETAQIDAFIAKNEELIALLDERRDAVILSMVTSDPAGGHATRPTGTRWIGEIPAGWSVQRLRTVVARARNGLWGDEPSGGDDDIRVVRVADFDRPAWRTHDRDRTLRKLTRSERAGRTLAKGDLLLEKSGGTERFPVGYVVQYDQEEPAVCSNFVARMELREGMHPRYWCYVQAAMYQFRITSRSLKQSTGIQNLDQASYFNELVPVPPAAVQGRIADRIDQACSELDSAVSAAQRAVALAKERRAALISAAVTGKIDVGVAA